MKLFCKKIAINKPGLLQENGPLLLACNHPNSFLDAVILDVLFDRPIYSLARGDVFVNKWVVRILTAFKILPVYRISEGSNNLQSNYETFDSCKRLFRDNALVLIFSEGKCINEWHLRKLKKGTARLAINSWEENIPLKVLPIGINYNSFRRFGKTVHIHFGNMMLPQNFMQQPGEGMRIQTFNQHLEKELQQLVYEIPSNDEDKKREIFDRRLSVIEKTFLFLPAILAWLIHQPLYLPVRNFTYRKTNHSNHYDSVLMALLLVSYPIYLSIISVVLYFITGSAFSFLVIPVFPLLAWCYVKWKPAV